MNTFKRIGQLTLAELAIHIACNIASSVVGQYTDAMSSETRTALTKAISDLNEALTLVRTEIRTLETNRFAYPPKE